MPREAIADFCKFNTAFELISYCDYYHNEKGFATEFNVTLRYDGHSGKCPSLLPSMPLGLTLTVNMRCEGYDIGSPEKASCYESC